MLVLEHADHETVQSLSRLNTDWHALASRKLWRHVSVEEDDELEALYLTSLRRPAALRSIRSMDIGPCEWDWTPILLDQFVHIWGSAHQLLDLTLSSYQSPENQGEDHTALLLTLIEHGRHLRLRAFKIGMFMTSDCVLHRFLETQPSIERLTGPRVFPTQRPEFSVDFLPHLRYLTLDQPMFPLLPQLVPGRPIQHIELSGSHTEDSFKSML